MRVVLICSLQLWLRGCWIAQRLMRGRLIGLLVMLGCLLMILEIWGGGGVSV